MTTTNAINSEGQCLYHPFVQLQRLSPRTGEWKALLDSCPLCAMDSKSCASSVCSSVCSGLAIDAGDNDDNEGSSSREVNNSGASVSSRGGGRERGRQRSLPLGEALVSLNNSDSAPRQRSTSRVRFGSASEFQAGEIDHAADDSNNDNNGNGNGGNPYIVRSLSSSSLPAHPTPTPSSPNSNYGNSDGTLHGLADFSNDHFKMPTKSNSFHSTNSSASASLLKSPRYKACAQQMKRQLDESEKVTTMSMDLDIANEDSDGSVLCEDAEDYQNEHPVELCVEIEGVEGMKEFCRDCNEEGEQQQQEEESESDDDDEDLVFDGEEKKEDIQHLVIPSLKKMASMPPPPQQKRASEPTAESNSSGNRGRKSNNGSRRHRSSKDHSQDSLLSQNNGPRRSKDYSQEPRRSSSCQLSGYRSIQNQGQASQGARPDPEEFPCGTSQAASQGSGSQQHQQQQSRQQQFQRRPRASSFNSHTTGSQQSRPMPPPPPPPPLPFQNSQLQATIRRPEGPCYTNMVVAQPNYDDEISTLSFMGNSVQSGQSSPSLVHSVNSKNGNRSSSRKHGEDKEPIDEETDNEDNDNDNDDTYTQSSLPMINTNDYDSKGRCIHHSHIKLRKKKLFGKGWKVLMSACPDCCVDELRRIRMVEENKRRMKEKQRMKRERAASAASSASASVAKSERSERLDRSDRLDRSVASGDKSLDGSHKSSGSQSRGSSSHISQGQRRSASGSEVRNNSLRSSSGSMGSSPGNHNQRQMVPPPPPPRLSPGTHSSPGARSPNDVRNVPLNKPLTSRRPSDGTASLTGSSERSSDGIDDSLNAIIKLSPRRGSAEDVNMHLRRSGSSNVNANNNSQGGVVRRSRSTSNSHANVPVVSRASQGSNVSRRSSTNDSNVSHNNKKSSRKSSTSRSQSQSQAHRDPSQEPQQQQSQQSSQQAASGAPTPSSSSNSPPRGTIHVRQMQWIDPKNSQSGTYTGQVNDRFVPHGRGLMEYDNTSSSSTPRKDGEWKNGRYRKSKSDRSTSRNSGRSQSKSTSGSGASPNATTSGVSKSATRSSRSKSREPGQSRSRSRSTDRRQRSSSRSTSKQPVMMCQQVTV